MAGDLRRLIRAGIFLYHKFRKIWDGAQGHSTCLVSRTVTIGSAHYDQIADEISNGQIDKGLWIEAFASCQGNEHAAKAQYIKLRVRKLRNLGFKAMRRPGMPTARGKRGMVASVLRVCGGIVEDLWTAWMWAWTFAFAMLTTMGLLCLGTMFYLKFYDEGVLAWPFFTVGCAFITFFLFGRGVQCLNCRPPTTLFYMVELALLGAAIWPVSHLMNPGWLGRIPRALSSELVFLVARFLNSGDAVSNALSVAVFFLPVYGVIAFLRQKNV